ncbi:MAG: hypothetical protein LLF89_04685 [Spirochaetaceae bacterium]|nr:hypothetical protein [Spirochaetaceae bacterium]
MAMTIEIMKERSRIVTRTREFFLARDYLETDTPALAPSLIPESSLEVFETKFVHPYQKGFPLYLIPSPEVWMKRVIAETGQNVFQLCKAFRNAESIGRIHNPEFTMLEYYTVGANSRDNIELTEELFSALSGEETPQQARPPFARMTMAEAFREFAGLDLDALHEIPAMRDALASKALLAPAEAPWEDLFNILFLSCVEPELPADRPLVLDEYPKEIVCLARDIPGRPCKERWELYVSGMEIANCFAEMATQDAVATYFVSQEEKKRGALVPHNVDHSYPEIFAAFPACSGVAIGFDRLCMALLGCKSIDEVLYFPFTAFVGADTRL